MYNKLLIILIWLSSGLTYDYFLFTQVWPPSWTRKSLPKEINYFTVHGIWPEYWNGSYPSYCNRSDPFNPKLIKKLIPILQYIWYEYPPNKQHWNFWKHEWNKHGTCCLDVFNNEYHFFNQSIIWHNQYPLLTWLKDVDIIPSENKTYSIHRIKEQLENKIGHKINILCKQKNILNTITLCFNKNLSRISTIIDCPMTLINCKKRVYFYPIKY